MHICIKKGYFDVFEKKYNENYPMLCTTVLHMRYVQCTCTIGIGWVKFSERKKTGCGSCKICTSTRL